MSRVVRAIYSEGSASGRRAESFTSLMAWREKKRYQGLYFLSFNSTKLVPNRRTARLNFLLFWLLIADSTNCLVQVHSYRNQRESEYASFIKEPFSPCLKSSFLWCENFRSLSSIPNELPRLLCWWNRLDSSARPPVKRRNWSVCRTGP